MNITLVVVLLAVALVLLVLVGLIAAAETAFTRVSRSRAEALVAAEAEDHADDDDEPDERVAELRSFTRRPLTTLASLGVVLWAGQAGVVACAWFVGQEISGRTGSVVAVAVAVVVMFAVTSLTRSRALLAPDTTAVGVVPLLRAVAPLGWLTSGIVALARRSSTPAPDPDVDEQQVLAIVGQTPAIDHDEEALIKRVVAFDDTVVGSIMTPRPDMVTLRSGFAVADALQVAALHGLSRIPVTMIEGDVDDVIGAVHVKDLMNANLDGRGRSDIDLWLRNVPVVPTSQRIANLMVDLKTSDMHLALVIDEHGGVAGVVTLEDILEELVGEIEDEFDQPEPLPIVVDDRTVRADGRCEVIRLEEATGLKIVGDFRTIAGCVFNGLGRVPEVGDVYDHDEPELSVEVLEMHGRRIAQLEIRSSAPFAMPVREPEADLEETPT